MRIDAISVELGTAVDIRSGYSFRGAIEEVPTGAVLVAQMKDVHANTALAWNGLVRTELRSRKEPDWLVRDDLLFVARGDRFFATCISAPPGPAVCGPHLLHLRVRRGSGIEPAFLAWQLNQPPLQRRLYAAAEGSNQLSIRVNELAAIRVPVPPRANQALIVELAAANSRQRQVLTRLIHNREQELAAIAGDLASAAGINEPSKQNT